MFALQWLRRNQHFGVQPMPARTNRTAQWEIDSKEFTSRRRKGLLPGRSGKITFRKNCSRGMAEEDMAAINRKFQPE
jgi:hypothetical protein